MRVSIYTPFHCGARFPSLSILVSSLCELSYSNGCKSKNIENRLAAQYITAGVATGNYKFVNELAFNFKGKNKLKLFLNKRVFVF